MTSFLCCSERVWRSRRRRLQWWPTSPIWQRCRLRQTSGSSAYAVATAEVVVSGRITGLSNVATRAEYRRQGIGMAMTFTALAEARRAGATLGVLQASNEGVGVYEKVGFGAFGEYREFKPPLAAQ